MIPTKVLPAVFRTLRGTIVWMLLFVALVGCGKVAPIDATRGGSEHYEWLLANSAADYLKVGKKNPTWDRSILRAFTNYAEARSGLNGTNSSSYWRSEFNRAIESGCE